MKIARYIFSLLILVPGFNIFYPATSAAKPDAVPCIIGYSTSNVSDVDPRDVEAALKVWAKELGDQYSVTVETNLYESVNKLAADFINKKLDFIVVTSIDYVRLAKTLKAKPALSQYSNGKPTVKYVALTGADVQKKGLDALKNKKFSISKNNQLGRMFLDTLLMQDKMPPSERFFAAVEERNKESQVILDVFFGKSGLCVVTATAFQTMKELNPQVERKLRVIAESPDLIPTIGLFQPVYPQDHRKRVIEGMSADFKHHERGKQIMLLFNIDKMGVITDGQLDSVRKLVADYDLLKRKQ